MSGDQEKRRSRRIVASRWYYETHPEKYTYNEARRVYDHRRRALKRTGRQGERIVAAEVFVRDGWRCGICGKRVRQTLAYPHPMSASLDHIVPLTKGGDHSMVNVQCAHLRCNTRKNDGVGGVGDQLRLLG